MKNNLLKVCVIAAAVSSAAARAESPSWTYIDASYVSSDLNAAEPEGLELRGSYKINDLFFVDGSYTDQDDDISTAFGDVDIELSNFDLGVGARYGLSETTDVYGRVAWQNWDIETDFDDEDENGYSAAVGVRSLVWEGLELNAEAGYIDVGDFIDGEFFFEVGGIYNLANGFGLGVSYGEIDDLETWKATIRYSFR